MFSLPNDAQVVAYVVRHGRTTLNADGRFRGNVDPPLDSVGIKQAQDLADLFADKPISAVFSSEKQRATKTAETIAKGRSLPIHTSSALQALNVGKLSGQKRTKENIALLQQHLDNPECQIPGGESLNDFRRRVDPCLHEAVCIGCKTGVPPIIVAHSSVVREVGTLLMGDHRKLLVEPGGAVAIYLQNGMLKASPVFRPMISKAKVDIIS